MELICTLHLSFCSLSKQKSPDLTSLLGDGRFDPEWREIGPLTWPKPRRSLCNSATETRTNLNTALVFDILKGLERTSHKTDLGLLLILTDSKTRSIIYTHHPQQQTAVVLTSSSTLTSSSSSTRKISYSHSAPLLF